MLKRDVNCYQQLRKHQVRERGASKDPHPYGRTVGLASAEQEGAMMGTAGIRAAVEGHVLTHADGAAGVQLAPWGALASKGAGVVPADAVHTRVRGALVDICGKKGTVTAASATDPAFWARDWGR